MSARLLLIHCLSPLHAGTGQSIGAVDLPIAREVSTGFPYLPGSSIKGSLRDAAGYRLSDAEKVKSLFGPDTRNASDHAGAVAFGDGRLLCMPVRSIHGTFAWATSPLLLQRFARDAGEAGVKATVDHAIVRSLGSAVVTETSILHEDRVNDTLIFEDLDFKAVPCGKATKLARDLATLLFESIAERTAFCSRFVILHDDAMSFLTRHAVDTITRASIDADTRTVKDGQLWTEENLPSESILAALVAELPILARRTPGGAFPALKEICSGTIQFGGHATIGRGRCRTLLVGG